MDQPSQQHTNFQTRQRQSLKRSIQAQVILRLTDQRIFLSGEYSPHQQPKGRTKSWIAAVVVRRVAKLPFTFLADYYHHD